MEDIKTKLVKLFQTSGNLSKNTLDEFFSLLTIKTIGKGIDIVIKGNRDTKEYFLLDGILREYTYNENADEVTLNFYVEESFILPNFCRTNEDISLFSIQALSITTIVEIEASEHELYFEKMNILERAIMKKESGLSTNVSKIDMLALNGFLNDLKK